MESANRGPHSAFQAMTPSALSLLSFVQAQVAKLGRVLPIYALVIQGFCRSLQVASFPDILRHRSLQNERDTHQQPGMAPLFGEDALQ